MKIVFAFMLSHLLNGHAADSTVYNFSFTTLEGQQHTMQEFQGKKVLVTVLPATQTADDSSYLKRIDSVALANAGQLVIIGVPSYEDGYTDSLTTLMLPFYRSFLDSSVLITQGVYTHQASGAQQSALFNWLTHASGNSHFEQEVGGTGEMFFINEAGALYGVFPPTVKYSNKILNRMLQATTN